MVKVQRCRLMAISLQKPLNNMTENMLSLNQVPNIRDKFRKNLRYSHKNNNNNNSSSGNKQLKNTLIRDRNQFKEQLLNKRIPNSFLQLTKSSRKMKHKISSLMRMLFQPLTLIKQIMVKTITIIIREGKIKIIANSNQKVRDKANSQSKPRGKSKHLQIKRKINLRLDITQKAIIRNNFKGIQQMRISLKISPSQISNSKCSHSSSSSNSNNNSKDKVNSKKAMIFFLNKNNFTLFSQVNLRMCQNNIYSKVRKIFFLPVNHKVQIGKRVQKNKVDYKTNGMMPTSLIIILDPSNNNKISKGNSSRINSNNRKIYHNSNSNSKWLITNPKAKMVIQSIINHSQSDRKFQAFQMNLIIRARVNCKGNIPKANKTNLTLPNYSSSSNCNSSSSSRLKCSKRVLQTLQTSYQNKTIKCKLSSLLEISSFKTQTTVTISSSSNSSSNNNNNNNNYNNNNNNSNMNWNSNSNSNFSRVKPSSSKTLMSKHRKIHSKSQKN